MNIRELDKWPDVVIVSTQGKRSIASLLADGGTQISYKAPFILLTVMPKIWTEVHFLMRFF